MFILITCFGAKRHGRLTLHLKMRRYPSLLIARPASSNPVLIHAFSTKKLHIVYIDLQIPNLRPAASEYTSRRWLSYKVRALIFPFQTHSHIPRLCLHGPAILQHSRPIPTPGPQRHRLATSANTPPPNPAPQQGCHSSARLAQHRGGRDPPFVLRGCNADPEFCAEDHDVHTKADMVVGYSGRAGCGW